MSSTIDASVKAALSPNRIGTYEQAKGLTLPGLVRPLPLSKALELYAWNAQISAAFMHPLHICEVVIRNGVANVLETVYGPRWPWSVGFLKSLPNPSSGYNMRHDLASACAGHATAGKVIPELKFAFWQRMFTSRHDTRLWTPFLAANFPHLPVGKTVQQQRLWLYSSLEHIRFLRNRIAHHEPIFARNLVDDFATVHDLIRARCQFTAHWMNQHQQVTPLLGQIPKLTWGK